MGRLIGAFFLWGLLGFTALPCVSQATASDVRVELSIKDRKSEFHSNEPILLELSFLATQGGASVNTRVPEMFDTVALTPSDGAFPWLKERLPPFSRANPGLQPLEANKPIVESFPLNDFYRFDSPGHYKVHVLTQSVILMPGLERLALTSNDVEFDVVSLSASEEAELAHNLETKIRAAKSRSDGQRLKAELDWLPGDEATKVKLSLLLNPPAFYPINVDVIKGLWIARNRAMVVAALERTLVDPTQEIDNTMLAAIAALKARLLAPYDPEHPTASVSIEPIKAGYLHTIAATLPQRRGTVLASTAGTVFSVLASQGQTESSDFAAAREALIAHFGDLDKYSVAELLSGYGRYLEDTRIVPALRHILESSMNPVSTGIREAALTRLAKLSPQELPVLLKREACSDAPIRMRSVRDLSPVETLPAVDDCLREKIRIETGSEVKGVRRRLGTTLAYTARFATVDLVPDVRKAYLSRSDNWSQEAVAGAVVYLMRWDPDNSLSLFNELLPRHDGPGPLSITFFLLDSAHSPAVGLKKALRQQIMTAPPGVAADCTFALSSIGEPEDRDFLRQQLERLQKRPTPVFSEAEGKLEGELVAAISGRSWARTREESLSLRARCMSDECKFRFRFAGVTESQRFDKLR